MNNPFEVIEARLNNIETLLLDLKHNPKEQGEQPETDELLTVQDTAKFLSLSVPTLYSKVSKGELPVMKRSKRLYFSRTELLEYLKQGRRKTHAEIAGEAEQYLTKKKGARMDNTFKTPNDAEHKDRYLILQFIVKQVEKGTGLSYADLKKKYSEELLFAVGLKHVTTTKKAFCEALNIPVEAGCRYKRRLEKAGQLVESVDEFICPFTKHQAHLISTNPKEFERLLQSKSNQLSLF